MAPNSTIDKSKVKDLKRLWGIETDSFVSSDPIINKDHVYFTDWEGNAYCAEKKSGKISWKIKVYTPPSAKTCGIDKLPLPKKLKPEFLSQIDDICLPYFWNGLAGTGVIYRGIWYVASIGGKRGFPLYNAAPGRLYAIHLEAQKVIWDVELTRYRFGGGLAKLLTHEGIIYVGISGVDECIASIYQQMNMQYKADTVGGVIAIDAMTGRKIWERQTIGLIEGDNEKAKGAGVWCSFALCPKLNLLYFGTGNNYGEPPSKSSDALVALDCKTGKLKWQKQVIKGDTWMPGDSVHPDDDFGAGPQLFTVTQKDKETLAIGIGNKDGYYYVFNRENGNLLWSTKVFSGDESGSGIRGNAAVSNGRIYVWSNNGWDEEESKDSPHFNITVACLDANSGEVIWSRIQNSAAAIGAGLLCQDVFFVGDISGNIFCYDTETGFVIRKFSIYNGSISSSLVGDEGTIYVGLGMPKLFGGLPVKGVYAYGLST